MFASLRAIAALAALVSQAAAIPQVTRTGRYLYQEDGTRFYIKGVGYQPEGEVHVHENNTFGEPGTFIDPLADSEGCARDVPILQAAGVNTLRVYSVNASLNHDTCMQLLSDAGIYTILDLSVPLNGSIPRLAPTWTSNLLESYKRTIDAFDKYDNVIAYNVGNEVILVNTHDSAPFVKAAARDTKAHLKSIGSSALVGYAAINSGAGHRRAAADYLSCGSEESAIDLYGLNEYTWCGDASFSGSGYASATAQFADYNVAAYFSEYGCIRQRPRLWTEINALLSSDMSDVWSGGIAFSYFPKSGYDGEWGLVTQDPTTGAVTPSVEFENLSTQYNLAVGPNTPSRESAAASTYPACVGNTGDLDASVTLPPTPDSDVCDCLHSRSSCQYTTPQSMENHEIPGELITVGCTLLGDGGCDDLSGNGQTGVYGRLSACDPVAKLSYVMSQYYESQGRLEEACSFAGNGTVNSAASTSDTALSIADSCIANPDRPLTSFTSTTRSSSATRGQATQTGTPQTDDNDDNDDANDDTGSAQALLGGTKALGFLGAIGALSAFLL